MRLKHEKSLKISNSKQTPFNTQDAMYYDGVLKALRLDQREQSGIIYRTTIIGQLAVENLDDRRVKYKKLAEEVWVNMKERERTLEIMRVRCNDVWEYAKSLVRTEVK